MDTNKLSLRLLADGWTKDQTPPGCRPWDWFYGGWTYDNKSRFGCVFETPCGLLYQRGELGRAGTMSYMGIDWTEENDCLTTLCPQYSRTEPCPLNHPILEAHKAGCHNENLHLCAVHETDKPYSYEHSARQVMDQQDVEKERRWEEFVQARGGRACRHQSRYNRGTREWSMEYDPEECARLGFCRRCEILQKDLIPQKGNVLCDERRTWIEKGHGLFQDEPRTVITKGIKVLKNPVSVTICEIIAKTGAPEFQWRYPRRWLTEMYFDPSLKIELVNFRVAERGKDKRDLAQDLQDIAAGIEVVHAADTLKAAAEQKRARRAAAKEQRIRKAEKMLLTYGWEDLDDIWKRRVEKLLDEDRIDELNQCYAAGQLEPGKTDMEQITLFE